VGNWVTGYGFINVKFPKETTRKLTQAEHERLTGRHLVIGDADFGPLAIDRCDVEAVPITDAELIPKGGGG
jgi:hypothetical protein